MSTHCLAESNHAADPLRKPWRRPTKPATACFIGSEDVVLSLAGMCHICLGFEVLILGDPSWAAAAGSAILLMGVAMFRPWRRRPRAECDGDLAPTAIK